MNWPFLFLGIGIGIILNVVIKWVCNRHVDSDWEAKDREDFKK